jgi:DNA-binding NarL/FixJ family response regulator
MIRTIEYSPAFMAENHKRQAAPSRLRGALTERLTRREIEVTECVAHGLLNKDIARKLGIAVSTVKNHLRTIYAKTRTENRVLLARMVWAKERSSTIN